MERESVEGAPRTYSPSSYQGPGQNNVTLDPASTLAYNTDTTKPVRRKPIPSTSITPAYSNLWNESKRPVSRGSGEQFHDQRAAWKVGFFVRFPILPFLALIGVLGCTIAAIIILRISDGVDVQQWDTYAPSVYLASFSVVANALLGYAFFEGLIIAFWRKLLAGGTILELNRNWQCGNSIWHVVRHRFRAGGRVTSIARIISILALFRGPIYQRASLVIPNHQTETQGTVDLMIAQYLPDGYAGIDYYSHVPSRAGITSRLTAAFTEILKDYSANVNLSLTVPEDCGDICSTTVKGFGYKSECSTTENAFVHDLMQPHNEDFFKSWTGFFEIAENPEGSDLSYLAGLSLNVTRYAGRLDNLNETVQRQYLTYHVCNLTGGTVEYKVNIQGNVVTLSPRDTDVFLKPVDLATPASNSGNGQTVIGGFQYASSLLFDASASVFWTGAVNEVNLSGSLANQMIGAQSGVGWIFNDPMDLMQDAIRNIAFRASLKAGRENTTITDALQTVSYTGYKTYSIYRTDYTFLAIAVALSLIGIISVAATFNGWWRIGRNMSMSPFEIAKAFDAPMMRSAGSNVVFSQYPEHVMANYVRYGATVSTQDPSSLAFGTSEPERLVVSEHGTVCPPKHGTIYGR